MKNERRDFLKGALGLGVIAQIPTATLVTGLLDGFVNQAFAATQNPADLLNYVGLWMNNGIERWYFDAMLAPNGHDPAKIDLLNRKNKIKNRSTVGSKSYIESLEYALTNDRVNGKIYLPYLWESQLPGISGNVPMKDLARHMISIRGVDTGVGFDAHGNNVSAAENAFGYPTSISALASTNSKFPFSGTHYGAYPMTALRNPVSVDVSNIAPTLKKFSLPSNGVLTTKVAFKTNEIRGIVDDFIKTFARSLPSSKQKAAQALLGNREAAKNMFDFVAQSMANIQADYQEAYMIYAGLMTSVANNHLEGRGLAGLDNMPINNPGQEGSFSNIKRSELARQFNDNEDVNFRAGNWTDLLEYIPQSNFDLWARSLATIEVFLKYNITNSMKLACNTQTGPLGAPGDVHFHGENQRLILHSKHYQAIATGLIACMNRLESIDDLQGRRVSTKTVFHLRSEFDRAPADSGVGSNHHIRGCTESFFSKMIQDGPIAIGNIRSGNIGTGLAITKGAVVEYKHIYSTVQNIAGLVRDRNFEPLLERNGDSIVPLTNECKDVA